MAVVRTNTALTDTQRERERQRVEGWRKSESQTWKLWQVWTWLVNCKPFVVTLTASVEQDDSLPGGIGKKEWGLRNRVEKQEHTIRPTAFTSACVVVALEEYVSYCTCIVSWNMSGLLLSVYLPRWLCQTAQLSLLLTAFCSRSQTVRTFVLLQHTATVSMCGYCSLELTLWRVTEKSGFEFHYHGSLGRNRFF